MAEMLRLIDVDIHHHGDFNPILDDVHAQTNSEQILRNYGAVLAYSRSLACPLEQ